MLSVILLILKIIGIALLAILGLILLLILLVLLVPVRYRGSAAKDEKISVIAVCEEYPNSEHNLEYLKAELEELKNGSDKK